MYTHKEHAIANIPKDLMILLMSSNCNIMFQIKTVLVVRISPIKKTVHELDESKHH